MISLDWKLRLPPGDLQLLMTLNQQATKGVSELSGVIDPDCHGVIGLLFHSRRMDCRGFLRAFLVLPCPMMNINAKLQERNPGMISGGLTLWNEGQGQSSNQAKTTTSSGAWEGQREHIY